MDADVTESEQRQNPYQLVFGAESIDDRLFPPIAEEAEARDQPLDDPDRFLFLSSVGQLLQAIAEPDPYQGRHVAEGREEDRPPVAGLEGSEPTPGGGGRTGAGPMESRRAPGTEPLEPRHPQAPEEASGGGRPTDTGPAGLEEPDVGAQGSGGGGGTGPSDDALTQYGRLLYHAFHYWREQKPTRRVDEDGLRWLLDEVTSVGDWTLNTPTGSGYLQLPRNVVWAEPAPGLTPEPVDGFFWRYTEPEDEPAHLHVLLVLGVRPDRAGFSVVPATGVLDTERHWAEVDARPDGTDFETKLPGGDMDALYSVENAAEVLKLASLCFWKLDPAAG